jgi:hypothetical protein
MAHHDGLPYENISAPAVGRAQVLDLERVTQQPEVGPPSPEHETTPADTPADDDGEDELLAGWRRETAFGWFGPSDG